MYHDLGINVWHTGSEENPTGASFSGFEQLSIKNHEWSEVPVRIFIDEKEHGALEPGSDMNIEAFSHKVSIQISVPHGYTGRAVGTIAFRNT